MQGLWPESLSATGAIKSKRILKMVEALVRIIYWGCDGILVQSKDFSTQVESLGVSVVLRLHMSAFSNILGNGAPGRQ